MNRQPIKYAIIRFQPHIETEEFANVGVVLVSPPLGYFDFRLETKRVSRLTAFFDPLDAGLARRVLSDCEAELQRIRSLAGYDVAGQRRFDLVEAERAEHLFAALTKDREGLLRYSDIRYAMDNDPSVFLDQLFDQYVSRNFADANYKEKLLERHFRNLLKRHAGGLHFRRRTYSDGLHTATFPFVGDKDGSEIIALKPIYLGQKEPMNVLDHANKWLFRVDRLRSHLPPEIAFAVKGPDEAGLSNQAFMEALVMFKDKEIKVITPDADALDAVARHLQ